MGAEEAPVSHTVELRTGCSVAAMFVGVLSTRAERWELYIEDCAGGLESPQLAVGGKGDKNYCQCCLRVQEHIARAAYVAEGTTHSTKCFCCFRGLDLK